jgi:hypothetical protein
MSQYSGETGKSGALGEGGQLGNDMKRLKEDFAVLRSDLTDLTKSLVRSGKDSAQNATERVREEISAHPAVSLLGAFGLGFLVAKLLD